MAVGKKFKVCMLTKATAATQAQTPHLREKFGMPYLEYLFVDCFILIGYFLTDQI